MIVNNLTTTAKYHIVYNLDKNNITSINGPLDATGNKEGVIEKIDEYFTKGICKQWGIGQAIAVFELVPALLLVRYLNSPATKTNFLTSFGELLQVLLGGTKRFGDPKKISSTDLKKSEEAKERRESIQALIQVAAGALGLTSFGLDKLNAQEKDIEDLSLTKRVTLSIASLLSSIFMFSGFLEKNLIAGIASKIPGTTEHNMMRSNGNSDFRCATEWLAMTFFPWLPKSLKLAIDLAIPLFAVREGASDIKDVGKISTIFSNKFIQIPKYVLDSLNKLPFPFLRNGEEKCKIPPLTKSNFFLDKIRNRLFIPALKLFKASPPTCYKEGDNLFLEFGTGNKNSPSQNEHELSSTGETNRTLQSKKQLVYS